MKKAKILVPTDFSECAHNALIYALGLSKDLNAEIVLFHAISYNDAVYSKSKITAEESTRRYNNAKINLDQEVDFVSNQNLSIPVKSILEGGLAEQSIVTVIETEHIDLIVMGTEGASSLKAVVFGSFAHNVILVATCPVFTIPLTGKYKGIKTIICTTEMDKSEINAVKAVVSLAEKFNANLIFYNVNSNTAEQDNAFSRFENLVKELTDYKQIDYVIAESNNVVESIDNFVCQINPDLVVTLGKEKKFFDKFFGPHVTKKLCLHTHIPLLSFPHESLKEKESETADLVKKYYN